MAGVRTAARIAAIVFGILFLLVAGAVAILTSTDWGRERIRTFGLEQVAPTVNGEVRVERLRGDLLSGALLENVEIVDSAGRPFLRADTVSLRYSLRSFLAGDVIFRDVQVVRPIVALTQTANGDWNFAGLFGADTTAADTTAATSRMRLEDVTVRDGTIAVRTILPAETPVPEPPAEARPAPWIVTVDGVPQRLMLFRDLDAMLPLVRLADPDSSAVVVDVDTASVLAFPIRPPGTHVQDVSGRFAMDGDTMALRALAVALENTRVRLDGEYHASDGAMQATIAVDTLTFEDLLWVRPELPAGGGSGRFAVARDSSRLSVAARELALNLDGGSIDGGFEVPAGDTLRVGEADLRFEGIDTRMLERVAGRPVPADGIASGSVTLSPSGTALAVDGLLAFDERGGRVSRVRVDGALGNAADGGIDFDDFALHPDPVDAALIRRFRPDLDVTGDVTGVARVTGTSRSSLRVDADLTHDGGGTGQSRLLVGGVIDMGEEPSARDLQLRLAPLRVGLIERLATELPTTGSIEGTATLNGTPMNRLDARIDLRHMAPPGESRVQGTAVWRENGAFDIDLQLPEVALAAFGGATPGDSARLRGTARGRIAASGTRERIGFKAGVALDEGGSIVADGTFAPGGGTPGYDIRALLDSLDLRAALVGAPGSRLTGRIAVQGRGTDPATVDATIDARFVDARFDSVAADTSIVLGRIAGGIATLDTAVVRVGGATASFAGTIGLVEGRTGELDYRIDVPRLQAFAEYLPADTGVVAPRPIRQARLIAQARADSLARALETAVQRAAVGYPAAPALEVDTVQGLPRDSVAGAILAEGTASGSLRRLNMDGTVAASDLVVAGMTVQDARAEFSIADFGGTDAEAQLNLVADAPVVAGFAFDSAGVRLDFQGVRDDGAGTLNVALFQDPDRDYRIASEFLLELDRRELTFSEMVMRFDTISWTAPRSGSLSWAGRDLTIDSLELLNPAGGRIVIDGSIDESGSDMTLEATHVPVAQIAILLQDTVTFAGLLDLSGRMQGTPAEPRLEGTFALSAGSVEDRPLPDTRIAFEYADALLRADANLFREGRHLLAARAELPIDLALTGVEGARLLDRELAVAITADSLPLETLPGFTDAVSDVRGRLRGDIVASGTWEEPVLNGTVDLDLASFRIVPAGVWLRDIAGAVRFAGDAVTVDSINATSGDGPIRITGTVGIAQLDTPRFDLRMEAERAIVLDTDRGRVRTDAELTLTGPMDSARVEGEVHIVEGVIRIPNVGENRRVAPLDPATVNPLVDTLAIDDAILPAPNPLLQNLTADIGVRVARDTWVRNSDANIEIYTPDDAEPLRVRYNVERPGLALEGAINADRGEYEFSGRVFELTTGAVTFIPAESLDPLIQLSANYEVARSGREALVIQIHVTGSLSEPRVALESTADPPLPESDLLSYLAFGRSASSVLDMGSGLTSGGSDSPGGIADVAQQQIASLALGTAIDNAVENIEEEGGRALDVFRIRPAPLPSELAFESAFDNFLRGTEIQAGKYLTTGLFVALEGRPSGESWPGVRMEYQTTNGFTWRVVWEPQYLPTVPSFRIEDTAHTRRLLGTFFYWSRRF